MRRILAVFHARNKEFIRDRSAFGWNFAFPFLIIVGFSVIFSGRASNQFKVGLVGDREQKSPAAERLLNTKYIRFVTYDAVEQALPKLARHQLDLLVDLGDNRYWVNSTSPKGYILERMLAGSGESGLRRTAVAGREIRYVDWLLPGVLGMNMMFSCLFGVGYVIVRYRKNGVLKRLSATPLTALEFLTAQVLSRFSLAFFVTAIVYVGCRWAIGFKMAGSYIDLAVAAAFGVLSLIALGVLVAARTASEEFAGGLLNIVTWPMMFLSGVWFSLEGSPDFVIAFSQCFPLTHLIDASRAIMNEGKSLADVSHHLGVMAGMTALFLGIGAVFFRWTED